jgi:predicted phosphodiesterase
MKTGFISDAHGNVGAFEQGVSILDALGCDQVVFLGDAVGYLPDPGIVMLIERWGMKAVLGNHEAMLLSGSLPSGDEVYQLGRCRELISDRSFTEIASWPEQLRMADDGLDIWVMHGSPSDLTGGYVFPDTDLESFARPSSSVTVVGNTHRPFWGCSSGGAWFLNPGSCGMPRDCGALGAVAVLDTTACLARIIRFDIKAATSQALVRCAPVHESVLALFDRPRPQNLVGEIYG